MAIQRLVFVENVSGVPHNIPVCVYEGTSLEELKAAFHAKIPENKNAIFQFYTKRFGSSYNSLCPDELPIGLEMVYVRARSVTPMTCATCGPKDNTV